MRRAECDQDPSWHCAQADERLAARGEYQYLQRFCVFAVFVCVVVRIVLFKEGFRSDFTQQQNAGVVAQVRVAVVRRLNAKLVIGPQAREAMSESPWTSSGYHNQPLMKMKASGRRTSAK